MRHIPGKLLHVTPKLFFLLNGINRIEFPAERYLLKAGNACLIPSGLPHSEVFVSIQGGFRMLVFMFDGGNIDFHACEMAAHGQSHEERQERMETNEGGRIAVLATKTAMDPYSPKINRALNLVSRHLEDPELGTAKLARWIGCAPDYLSCLFHKETKTPLVRHIQIERVNKAQYLLIHSEMSVKEIAGACGFGDPDYFTRLFHRFNSMVPSHYWSLNRAGNF